jgi:hypothetical protein
MVLELDNKDVADLANNWSASRCTRHIVTGTNFLCELKEQGLLCMVWIPLAENSSDLFTKNLHGPLFEKHLSKYVSGNEDLADSQGESVEGQTFMGLNK